MQQPVATSLFEFLNMCNVTQSQSAESISLPVTDSAVSKTTAHAFIFFANILS